MVSMVDFRLSCLGSSLSEGQCGLFFGKTIYSHSDTFHPGIQMGTAEFIIRVILVIGHHPIMGGVKLLLVTKCCRHQDKLWYHDPLIRSIFHSDLIVVPRNDSFSLCIV